MGFSRKSFGPNQQAATSKTEALETEAHMFTPRNRRAIKAQVVQGVWPCDHGEHVGFNPTRGAFLISTMTEAEVTDIPMRGTDLLQKVDIFMDPFGRHITKIGQNRAQRQQPPISLEALRLGRKEQMEILRKAWPFPDKFPDPGQPEEYDSDFDEGKQIRITMAGLTLDREVLEVLTRDPSREVKQTAYNHPDAYVFGFAGGLPEGFYLSNPCWWGPQIDGRCFKKSYTVGITINPYSFDQGRHLLAVSRPRRESINMLDTSFFSDCLDIIYEYFQVLRNGREGKLEWIDWRSNNQTAPATYEKIPANITWGTLKPDDIDGLMLGMNFGIGRLMEIDGSTNSIKTTSWASHMQAHMQFSTILKDNPSPDCDQITRVCNRYRNIDFVGELIKAYRNTGLTIWEDKHVMLYAARAPRGLNEMGVVCKKAANLFETDESMRRSIALALNAATLILKETRQHTFNIVSYGRRLHDKCKGQRLLFEIIPRGGMAYSELAHEDVIDGYAEDFVADVQAWLQEKFSLASASI